MDHNYICNKKSNYSFYQNAIHQKDEDERMLKDISLTKHLCLVCIKFLTNLNYYQIIQILSLQYIKKLFAGHFRICNTQRHHKIIIVKI